METHPASIEEKLGFDVLRARLAELTESALGRDRLRAEETARMLDVMRARLERTQELRDAFAYDDAVPLRYLDVRGALRRAAPEGAFLDPDELHALRLTSAALRRTKGYFGRRSEDYPRLHALTSDITPLEEFEAHISELLDSQGRLRDGASEELARLREEIRRTEDNLRETLRHVLHHAVRQGWAAEEQPTLRGGRRVIPVRAEAKRKIEGFVHDTSASGQTVYIEPAACLDLNNEVRALQSAERREIERLLRAATDEVRTRLDPLRTGVQLLARFDLLQAKARLADRLDACVPDLNADGVIDVREGRNPVLQLHFEGAAPEGAEARSVVPLDLKLSEDRRTLVITGPNAGGKTVAMKTIGLFALMLAHGLPLPAARHTRFSFFEKLLVDVGDEQSIEEDLSTFSSHVANLRVMVERAGPGALVLIDEAGTGTDPAEGGALARAVLERLTAEGARTIATTHHGTLKAYAHEAEGVENGSMAFDQETLRPTYRFRTGVPGSSYAFEIAERMGLPTDLLERARALGGERRAALEDLISEFEERNQTLEEERDEARAAFAAAEKERAAYEDKVGKLEKERVEIRRQALEEAERTVKEANARIERTIREIKEAGAEQEATRQAREAFEAYGKEVEERRAQAERGELPDLSEESALAKEGEKTAEASAPSDGRERTGPPGGRVEEGDRVVVDGGSARAEVVEIEDGEAVVAQGAVRMRVDVGRLTKVGDRGKQQAHIQRTSGTALPALEAESRANVRGMRVNEARPKVERLIDDAHAAGLHRVEILHGKGTGTLRTMIHEYLTERPEVAHFEMAPIEQGGAGVTIVELK